MGFLPLLQMIFLEARLPLAGFTLSHQPVSAPPNHLFLLVRVYWCVQKLPNKGHAEYTSCLASHYIAVRSFSTAVFLNNVFPDAANGAEHCRGRQPPK